MNADGTDLTRLTDTPGAERDPVWSPDGQRIAFIQGNSAAGWSVGGGSARGAIYVINADGTNLTQITDSSIGKEDIAWSPDGQRIAFASERNSREETSWRIYVVNADGTGLTLLSQTRRLGPAHLRGRLAWSSDSQRIAVSFGGGEEIYSMSPDRASRIPRVLSISGIQPAWSPDGQRIAFVSGRDGNHEIYVKNADGSGETRLTYNPRHDVYPAWSPDSQRIAFRSYREDGYAIYVMNADGTDQTRLTNRGGGWLDWLSDLGTLGTGGNSPAWSPDGRHIAFVSYFRVGLDNFDTEILVMNADGTGITRLTHDRANAVAPAWSPR